MKKNQFITLISIQVFLFILLLLFINFRTPHRENSEPPALDNKEQEILKEVYPRLALYIPNLYEFYFDGIGYDKEKNIVINLSDYCHLRRLGCYDGCLFITINKENRIIKVGGCALRTMPFQDSLEVNQINSLKRDIYNEMQKK
jgi:hypothetical protein